MKYFISVTIALILSLTTAMAQEIPRNYCGTTELSPQQRSSLEAIQQNMQPSLMAEPEVTYYLPLKFHVVGRDDGSGRAPLAQVLESICNVNDLYAGSGIQFYLDGTVHFIDNADYYTHDYQTGGLMMQQNNVGGKVNVYIVLDAAGNCGYYNPMADAVAVGQGCMNEPTTTLAHELGHYLSLPHTFNGWESGTPPTYNQERADGSNCKNAGDGFCDTPADYLADRWFCPYTGEVLTDPVGDTVIPDETQIMSYSSDYCQTQFSNEQQAAMRFYVKNYKQGMAASFVPYNGPVSTPSLIAPKDGQPPVPANYAEFTWHSVPNAYAYHVQVSRYSAMVNNSVDRVVMDTLFASQELLSGTDYYWRVRPLAQRNTCTNFTNTETFAVAQPTGMGENTEPVLEVYPNPVKGGQPLNIALPGAMNINGTAELVDLSGKVTASIALSGSASQLPTSNTTKGVYLLRIRTDAFTTVRKISIY